MITKSLPLLILCLLTALSSSAQVDVFSTFKDWKEHKPLRTYQSFAGAGHVVGKPFAQFIPVGGGKAEREKEFWGFTVGDKIYRLDEEAGKYARIVRLQVKGSICLWVIRGADDLEEGQEQLPDFLLYLSEDMNGDLIAMPHGLSSWSGMGIGSYKRFLKDNKDGKYRRLCECLEKERSVKNALSCVETYNAEHPSNTE